MATSSTSASTSDPHRNGIAPMTGHSTFFEDIAVGSIAFTGTYALTRDEVIDFARKFDPQPFHLDDEAAARSVFGRLAASGSHTIAISVRLLSDLWTGRQANMGGLGIDRLQWLKPVYPGDVLRLRITPLTKRRSRSRPELGLVTYLFDMLNQDDLVVMTYESGAMVALRDPAAPPEA
jgi:acyl dehydratase